MLLSYIATIAICTLYILQYIAYINMSQYIANNFILQQYKAQPLSSVYYSSNASSSSSSTSALCCTDLASGQSSLLALRNISMSRLSGSIFFLNAVIFSLHLENSLSSKLVVGWTCRVSLYADVFAFFLEEVDARSWSANPRSCVSSSSICSPSMRKILTALFSASIDYSMKSLPNNHIEVKGISISKQDA